MESRLIATMAGAGLAVSVIAGGASSGSPPARTAGQGHPAGASATSPAASFSDTVRPMLGRYCVGCHGGKTPAMDLALDRFTDDASASQDAAVWEKVLKRLRARTMPPAGLPRPSEEEYGRMIAWMEKAMDTGGCAEPSNPGRVTMRRLNRAEYHNTIRDLVGIDFKGTDDFPSDDVGYGFDNIGDVLSLPPLLMEKYVAAAEQIVNAGYPKVVSMRPGPGRTADQAARAVLARFATHAYRRPVTPDELKRLVGLVDLAVAHGDGYDAGMKLALQAVLVSPYFLFRVERDPTGTVTAGSTHVISDYELASRLSYFLWSSAPDDELLALAKSGTLRKDGNLERQVRRMLLDPKASGLVQNFGGQWLQTRRLKRLRPDPGVFPAFDEKLRAAMLTETSMFFGAIMREDRSILDFIDGRYTFLNERLARHYGITGVKGPQFRRVALTGDRRGGVLTQASILTLTSNPTRTSPVKRGKWILEQFLNESPPPPPPGVVPLSDDKAVVRTASLRVRMEQHRADPKCASCHTVMDPIGFSFEHYDGIGMWRTKDGAFPIDSTGKLPDGYALKGPADLRAYLLTKKKEFGRCLTEKMLTYALGRGLEPYDRCDIDGIAASLAKHSYRFSSLVLGIVESGPFQNRGPEAAPQGAKDGA